MVAGQSALMPNWKNVAQQNIIGETKAHRLCWLDHIERIGEVREVKRAYLDRPTRQRPVVRPRYRRSDTMEVDLPYLQPNNWREIPQDSEKRCNLASEAKVHFGSLSQPTNKVHSIKNGYLSYINKT